MNVFEAGAGATVISGLYGLAYRAMSLAVDIPPSIAPIPPTLIEMVPLNFSTGALFFLFNRAYARTLGKEPGPREKVTHLDAAYVICSFPIEAVFKQTSSRELAKGFGPVFIISSIIMFFVEIQRRYQNR